MARRAPYPDSAIGRMMERDAEDAHQRWCDAHWWRNKQNHYALGILCLFFGPWILLLIWLVVALCISG